MKQKLIQTHKLTKIYKNFKALDSVDMTVSSGQIYGLIGKNGAGKTTLLKLLMGLSEKTSGEIQINNKLLLNKERSSIGFMIGLTFFPYLNAYQNLEYYRMVKGIRNVLETERVLKLVDMHNEKKPFRSFSLGMKQRLGIANALLGNPPIVILDEPINGLDPQGILDIRNLILETNKTYETTFIISSHILSELDLVANKFGFINKGRLIEEIYHHQLHKKRDTKLTIEVDNPASATTLLYKILNIVDVQNVNNKLIISQQINEPNLIARTLIENKIEVYSLVNEKVTLEDYFINLIGGRSND